MGGAKRFLAILATDLRTRSRTTRFWVVLVALSLLTWWCFPPLDAGYTTVSLGNDIRVTYSSAWIGMTLGLMYATLMSLLGFYLVRGTLVTDFDTRVWQLLVATPMTRPGYLLAKWTSHLVVFGVIMAIGLLIGLSAQLWRAEDTAINLLELVKPVLVISLPAMAVTAMLAVLFDLVPWLRRTAGNVLYFFVWMAMVLVSVVPVGMQLGKVGQDSVISGPVGLATAWRDLSALVSATHPSLESGGLSIGSTQFQGAPILLSWTQWTPSAVDLAGRGLWVLVSIVAIIAMSRALDWAASRSGTPTAGNADNPGRALRWLDVVLRPLQSLPLGVLLAAELKLVLRGRRLWWWLALAVLGGVQLFGSMEALGIACIGAWLISTDVLARAVLRERETGTAALVYVAAHARTRMLAVRLAVAVALALIPVLPALVRLAITSPAMSLTLAMTALSVALAGMALGVLCRNPRPFELLLVVLAYIGLRGDGPLNVTADPMTTLAQHAVIVPLFAAILVALWPRHTGVVS